MRRANILDFVNIFSILNDHGIQAEDMAHDKEETWIEDRGKQVAGFYTMRIDHKLPHILHFYVEQSHKNPGIFYRMTAHIRRLLAARGYSNLILHARESDHFTNHFIQRYAKCQPYASKSDQLYYLMEVKNKWANHQVPRPRQGRVRKN